MERQTSYDTRQMGILIDSMSDMGSAAVGDDDPKPRAWIIALSCSWINLFVFAVFRSAGVLFMALVRTFGCTHAQAAWPITLASGVAAIACLPAGFLSHYFAVRTIVSNGILITSSAIAICFFTDSITSMILLLGIAQGIGIGFITGLLPVIISQYFGRKSTAACGLSYAGSGVGAFVFPIVFQYLLDSFGLRGSLLIMAALTFHAIAGALLLSPPTVYRLLPRQQTHHREETTGAPAGARHDMLVEDCDLRSDRHSDQESGVRIDPPAYEASGGKGASAPTTGHEHDDGCCCRGAAGGQCSLYCNLSSNPISQPSQPVEELSTCSKEYFWSGNDEDRKEAQAELMIHREERHPSIADRLYLRMAQDAQLLHEPYFFLITLTYVSYILGNVSLIMILPDYVVSLGQTPHTAVLLLSLFSVTDLLGRLLPGWLSCCSITVPIKSLYSTSIGAMGVLFCLFPILQSVPEYAYLFLVCLTLCCGFVSGCQMILPPVMAAEMLGQENTAMAFAMSNFICGFFSFSRPFLFRRLMDGNNYDRVFYFFGAFALISCFAWILEFIYHQTRVKKHPNSLVTG